VEAIAVISASATLPVIDGMDRTVTVMSRGYARSHNHKVKSPNAPGFSIHDDVTECLASARSSLASSRKPKRSGGYAGPTP
jgi:hypothetical protein